VKIKLYLETSVFGFYFDKNVHNIEKNASTIKLFNLIKNNYYEGFISAITLKEINNIPEEYKEKFIKLINNYKIKLIENDDDTINNIEYFGNLLIKKKIIPENMMDDALHISNYIFSGMNYLISWNCKHITNAKVLREIKILLLDEGINKNIEIYTPMEVIYV
jgi:hypothetical protein